MYQISNEGKVKNSNGLVMKQRYDKDKYKRISLTEHSIAKTFFIHKLVANVFLENEISYECVNHKDENKENNAAENLEWCSKKYNNGYGSRKGIIRKPKVNKIIDITSNVIYKNMAAAGRFGNVTSGAIYNCCIGRNKTSYGHKFMFYDEYMTKQEAILGFV